MIIYQLFLLGIAEDKYFIKWDVQLQNEILKINYKCMDIKTGLMHKPSFNFSKFKCEIS